MGAEIAAEKLRWSFIKFYQSWMGMHVSLLFLKLQIQLGEEGLAAGVRLIII